MREGTEQKALSGYYVENDICTPKLIAALFTIAKRWKKLKCPLTDEWLNKMWHIHTMEYYSAFKGRNF